MENAGDVNTGNSIQLSNIVGCILKSGGDSASSADSMDKDILPGLHSLHFDKNNEKLYVTNEKTVIGCPPIPGNASDFEHSRHIESLSSLGTNVAREQLAMMTENDQETNSVENDHSIECASKKSNYAFCKRAILDRNVVSNSFLPHFIHSDILSREAETDSYEQGNLRQFSSLKPNQSIYKLAYDENLTDQSETDETNSPPQSSEWLRSNLENPSPESQVPSSIPSAEILIHEADSASEAGSEDVELLPHRYESESFLNDNKHMYINKLSLAVELLRTRENLPYDEEFKRVEENNNENTKSSVQRKADLDLGEVNPSFINDVHTLHESDLFALACKNYPCTNNSTTTLVKNAEVEKLHRRSGISAADSGVQSEDSEYEACEATNETCDMQHIDTEGQKVLRTPTDEINASYFRFGVQAQHRFNIFSPKTGVVNPCFCCIIM